MALLSWSALLAFLHVPVAGARATLPTPPAPAGAADAMARFDRMAVPGSTRLQRRLVLLEGELIFGTRPCSAALRWDAQRGVTVGCLQFGLLGHLQPVLAAMDHTRPDLFEAAFGGGTREVRAMLRLPSTQEQAAWGRSLGDGAGGLAEPWATGFARLAALPEFQAAYVASTNGRFATAVGWARRFGLRSSRGLAMMFDLALYKGIAPADVEPLAEAADRAAIGKHGPAAELARLRALSAARSAIEPDDSLLRFHLDAIAAGKVVLGGPAIDFATLDVSPAPMAPQPGERVGPSGGPGGVPTGSRAPR